MFIINNVGSITRTHVTVEHAPLHLPHQGHHIHFGRGPSQARPPQDPKVFGFDYTCLILRQLPLVTLLPWGALKVSLPSIHRLVFATIWMAAVSSSYANPREAGTREVNKGPQKLRWQTR